MRGFCLINYVFDWIIWILIFNYDPADTSALVSDVQINSRLATVNSTPDCTNLPSRQPNNPAFCVVAWSSIIPYSIWTPDILDVGRCMFGVFEISPISKWTVQVQCKIFKSLKSQNLAHLVDLGQLFAYYLTHGTHFSTLFLKLEWNISAKHLPNKRKIKNCGIAPNAHRKCLVHVRGNSQK